MDTLKAQRRRLRKTEQRKRRRAQRSISWRTRRCFFTWPLGHEWVDIGSDEHPNVCCVSCGTPRTFRDRRQEIPDTIAFLDN